MMQKITKLTTLSAALAIGVAALTPLTSSAQVVTRGTSTAIGNATGNNQGTGGGGDTGKGDTGKGGGTGSGRQDWICHLNNLPGGASAEVVLPYTGGNPSVVIPIPNPAHCNHFEPYGHGYADHTP